jgi:hypothetical protein
MQFEPLVHTKEFLLGNAKTALELAEQSPEFALSSLVNDFDLLSLADKGGVTVAHYLAQHQPEWLQSDASKAHEILRIANDDGFTVAHELAKHQPEWLLSEASSSPEILRLASDYGYTVAHRLAQHQPEWLQSDASKATEILRLANDIGVTVAHYLAQHQPEWLLSEASNSPEILLLASIRGFTVAHYLAQYQPNWLLSDASKSTEILRLASKAGGVTVAFEILIHQSEGINHQPLMQKQILTLDCYGRLLAEKFTEKYGDTHGLDTSTMAMKLIEQGAAYKHSQPLSLKIGNSLLKKCRILIEDSLDVQISLKQLMATYSTFHHNFAKITSTQEQKSLQKWQDILLKSETLLCQHLNTYPELYDIEHTVDIFCEPADVLLKKIQSERILGQKLSAIQDSIHTTEIESIKPAIY